MVKSLKNPNQDDGSGCRCGFRQHIWQRLLHNRRPFKSVLTWKAVRRAPGRVWEASTRSSCVERQPLGPLVGPGGADPGQEQLGSSLRPLSSVQVIRKAAWRLRLHRSRRWLGWMCGALRADRIRGAAKRPSEEQHCLKPAAHPLPIFPI